VKVSYRWLKDYTSIPWSPEELAEKLTMAGIEVGSIDSLAPDLPNVYVGEIVRVEPHPQADLSVCQIDLKSQMLTIVCGAPNARVGLKVPVALVGAVLPNGMQIKEVELQGVVSSGMACSEQELGLGDDHSGVMELPADVQVGQDLVTALGFDDQILDISVYANRPDLMSMLGIAREVAALAGTKLAYPDTEVPETDQAIEDLTSVTVEDSDKCPRYCARVISDVAMKASPLWMQQRLRAVGMRPINIVVDITNFVMLETGQPLHAFDYDQLGENRIVVRTPAENETHFVTLDGIERELSEDMLMICDAEKPVCIGGVMGGENTEVTDRTKTILLEAANFKAANIRRTARKLAIGSEAAARFEKGIDPEAAIMAINRAAKLLADLAGGRVARGIIDVNYVEVGTRAIELRPGQVNSLLGTGIDQDAMVEILTRLELEVDRSVEPWLVQVPPFRRDLELECDLIEEIARFWGYDKIPVTLPGDKGCAGGEGRDLTLIDQIKAKLVGAGLSEIVTYAFVNRQSLVQSGLDQIPELSKMIALANPLTEEHAVMRTTLMPSLLECAAYNFSRQQQDLSLFEVGSVYLAEELPLQKRPVEEKRLALLLAGERIPLHWSLEPQAYDFYDLKGLVELVLSGFAHELVWERGTLPIFHPGRQSWIAAGGRVIAVMGEVHPEIQKNYRLPGRVYLAEVSLDHLFQAEKPVPEFQVLPKYPSVDRDLALLVSEDIPVGLLIEELKQAGGSMLQSIEIFDVYQGRQIAEGQKSVAFSFIFQADRSLTDEEVNDQLNHMYQALKNKFDAKLR
jgi:phenylalanyl-tRNA synthetase beta chain